jgi:beta-glucanase (GH16 family)
LVKKKQADTVVFPTIRPAFWTLGAAYRGNYQNWPGVGEFDILENVNGANKAYGVLHCDKAPGGACNEFNGLSGTTSCPGSSCNGNWHVYGFEVDRSGSVEALRWYIDGQLFQQVLSTSLPRDVWAKTVQKPHFVLLNLAMGGSLPNAIYGSSTPIASTTSGGQLLADYVAVYNSV